MSKEIIKIILFVVLGLSFSTMYSQIKKNKNYSILYIDFNDKALESHHINVDTTTASFSIYIEKYETKKAREKANYEYNHRIGNPDSSGPPTFSIGLYAFNSSPERLKTLKGVNYITIDDFRKNGYKTMSPTYIIHKLKDGTYLQWKTYTIE
jgi:hypothetical protein